jgi:hypothetical protein
VCVCVCVCVCENLDPRPLITSDIHSESPQTYRLTFMAMLTLSQVSHTLPHAPTPTRNTHTYTLATDTQYWTHTRVHTPTHNHAQNTTLMRWRCNKNPEQQLTRQILGTAFVLSTRACCQLGDTVIEVVRPGSGGGEHRISTSLQHQYQKHIWANLIQYQEYIVFFANWDL